MTVAATRQAYYECNWYYGGACSCGGGHAARVAFGDAQASLYWHQLPLPFPCGFGPGLSYRRLIERERLAAPTLANHRPTS